ncbi:DUF721 domain-containing protein [Streptomyces glaucescens]|uniref:DUF721 domain-containing protein n=1 Tax=Streptomyces glaucescens TaxID=1907 RepID=UPI000A388FB9|nr:DUF721 domain-containing protein [Streptomyces glaucescens]
MTDTPQMVGADLARLALANARAAAKTSPAPSPARTKTKRATRRGDGRDPITLAAAITNLGADLPLEAGIAGGNILDQWPTLCPQYTGCVEPVAYDEQRGRLDLRPATHAYAAQLRLLGGQLAKQINDKLGKPVVRSIRVLPVGNLNTAIPRSATAPREELTGPVKTRDTASPGYREALALVLAHKPDRQPTNPYVREAIAAHETALRAKRQPESEHRDAYWAEEEARRKAGPPPGSMEASERAARDRKRREAAGLEPRRAFDVA